MPHAIVMSLQRTNDAPLPLSSAEYIHAAFFHLVARADRALAKRLHADAQRRPFTLGSLRETPRDSAPSLRVTFLEDSLFALFAGTLLAGAEKEEIRVGEARFLLTGLLTTPDSHPLAGYARYDDLLACAEPAGTLAIRFTTPTVFRSQGRDVLWPQPRLVWQSWTRAWLQNAAEGLPSRNEAELMEQVERRVKIERYTLRTRRVALKEGALEGFTGLCVYGLRALSEDERRLLTALARFAFYAGTGRKTAMGMGQTRVMSMGY